MISLLKKKLNAGISLKSVTYNVLDEFNNCNSATVELSDRTKMDIIGIYEVRELSNLILKHMQK